MTSPEAAMATRAANTKAIFWFILAVVVWLQVQNQNKSVSDSKTRNFLLLYQIISWIISLIKRKVNKDLFVNSISQTFHKYCERKAQV